MPPLPSRSRVYLFITRPSPLAPPARQLFVFSHADPRHYAGIQTPGGTIDPGEPVLLAALREATEETGLTSFAPPTLLTHDQKTVNSEPLHRFFVHLPVTTPTPPIPDTWTHLVTGQGLDHGILFHFRWLTLPPRNTPPPLLPNLHPHFQDHLNIIP